MLLLTSNVSGHVGVFLGEVDMHCSTAPMCGAGIATLTFGIACVLQLGVVLPSQQANCMVVCMHPGEASQPKGFRRGLQHFGHGWETALT